MDRQLINYLPYVVREYPEFQGINTGEQPEFEQSWNDYEEVFANQFIDTALNYGLSRWERMLHIVPKATDTLDVRRARIKMELNNSTPYTFRVLIQMIEAISNGEPFTVSLEPGSYLFQIETHWGGNGQMENLEWLITNILPENLAINARNKLICDAEGLALLIGGVCVAETFFITNDSVEHNTACGTANLGAAIANAETLFITNDSSEQFSVGGEVPVATGTVITEFFEYTQPN